MKRIALLLLAIAAAVTFVDAQTEKLDYATIGRIRDEGLNRSQVMDHVSWLADVYGPRLTGSPAIQQASEWAMKRFGEWGLANIHQERWKFGKGWSLVRFSAHLIEPQVQPLIGFPVEWSAGTKGAVTADVVRVQIANETDFAKYRGKLAGKILLTQPARQVRLLEGPIILRMDDKWTAEAQTTPVPAARGGRGSGAAAADDDQAGGRGTQATAFRQKLSDFPGGGRRRGDLRARQRHRYGRRRQRSDVAAAAAGRRHDLPGRQRAARRQRRQRCPAGDARRRTLQPDDPRARQRAAGESRVERRNEVLR
jgi:hypothetical protein